MNFRLDSWGALVSESPTDKKTPWSTRAIERRPKRAYKYADGFDLQRKAKKNEFQSYEHLINPLSIPPYIFKFLVIFFINTQYNWILNFMKLF